MIKNINLLSLSVLFFLSACVPNEKVETKSQEIVEVATIEEAPAITEENIYGIYTSDIQNLLELSPIGSEIYLKEEENGDLYLRIEKIFTAENFRKESAKYFEESVVDEENSEVVSGSDTSTPEILTI